MRNPVVNFIQLKLTQLLVLILLFIACQLSGQFRGLYLNSKPVENEKRKAILIGNNDYRKWSKLSAPIADITLIGDALKSKGFDVQIIKNASRQGIWDALRDYEKGIDESTVSIIYFAGHGIEANGINYIIPIDDNSDCIDDLASNSIKLNDLHDKIKSKVALNIIVLDACRNTPLPFTCADRHRSTNGSTLAKYEPKGSFIAYSTSPGTKALDRKDGEKYSPYASALAEAIKIKGFTIEQVFKQVRKSLENIGQTPWESASLTGDFYFELEQNIGKANTLDSDFDGILDIIDACPYEKGDISQKGCPKHLVLPKSRINLEMVKLESGNINYGFIPKISYAQQLNSDVYGEPSVVDGFQISKYEITNQQFVDFLNEYKSETVLEGPYKGKIMFKKGINFFNVKNKWITKKGEETKPACNVSWFGALTFAEYYGFTLPTQLEWEFAARSGKINSKSFYAGSNDAIEVSNCQEISGNEKLNIGSKLPNAAGIYDMSGNVSEWCIEKFTRGGSFNDPSGNTAVTSKKQVSPEICDIEIGFRVIKK